MTRSSKMRILYIGPIPPEVGGKTSGGVATYCWELAQEAFKKGYEVYIMPSGNSLLKIEDHVLVHLPIFHSTRKLYKYLRACKAYLTYEKKLKSLIFLSFREKVRTSYLAYRLDRVVQLVKPDLIHVLHILDVANFALGCIDSSPPIIVTEHGVGLLYQYEMHKLYGARTRAQLFKRVMESARRAQCIVSVSEFSKASFLDVFGVPEHGNIKAILNPINPDKVPLLDKAEAKKLLGLEEKPVLLFCGVHLPIQRKGLDILLTAISKDEYLCNKCKLIVVTNKEGKVFADKFFTRQGLDGLTFVSLPRETLVKVYNAADVFVMPSRQEGIGLVYYEALLAGTPVVGFYKSVQELECELGIYIGEGFNAATEGPKDLAEKIKKVLNMRIDRQALRKAVVEKLSWEVKFQEYDRIYREVLTEATSAKKERRL